MFRLYLCTFLLIIANTCAATEPKPSSLTFGILPYITPSELMKKYTPLANYLTQKTGITIKLTITKNYKDHIDKAGHDQLDIAFLGGLPYIKIVEQYGKKRLLARYEMQNAPYFHSIIFVAQQSPIHSLSELAGKRFAFGNKNSTLSTFVPRYMLQQAGVTLDKLASYDHLATHEDVILGVLLGSCDAGAVAQEVYHEYQTQYPLRELALSPEISTHIITASNHLSDDVFDAIQTALFDLKQQPDAKTVLNSISDDMTGFVPVKDSDYNLLRNIVHNVTD